MDLVRGSTTTAPTESAAERIARSSRRPKNLGQSIPGAVSLAMGEPDTGTPERIVAAATTALAAGRTRYAPMTGSMELMSAIATRTEDKYGRVTAPSEVVLTHGGSAGLAATMIALVNPGQKVLIPEPTYSLYADHAAMVGAESIWVPNTIGGGLDLDMLREEASGARMIILCNPGNPTGRVYQDSDIHAVGQILRENPDLLLLSDEAYADIIFDGAAFTSALTLTDATDQVISCSTFSKTYSMTGWRLGYVIAPAHLATKINLIHRTINGSLNTFVQDAALEALRTTDEELLANSRSYEVRRDIVLERLNAIPGVTMLTPQGAFYAFPKIDSALSSDEMAAKFTEAGVLVRSGSEFGPSGEGHVRISFATDIASLEAGLTRFANAVRDFS